MSLRAHWRGDNVAFEGIPCPGCAFASVGALEHVTLIAVGVGAAWATARWRRLHGNFPGGNAGSWQRRSVFEAAAVIVVLVLVGQVLELRARARTSGAIKALLKLSPPTALRVTETAIWKSHSAR